MARMVGSIIESGAARSPTTDLRVAADLASGLLRKTLDLLARLDTVAAVSILKEDDLIDAEFDGFVRKLITRRWKTRGPPSLTRCSWPRRSSALAITPKTWPNSSSTWSRASMCATPPWMKSNPAFCEPEP